MSYKQYSVTVGWSGVDWEGGWENWRLCALCSSQKPEEPVYSWNLARFNLCQHYWNCCITILKWTTLSNDCVQRQCWHPMTNMFLFQCFNKHIHRYVITTPGELQDTVQTIRFKSTQSNIRFCYWKKGNHGNDIFQAGESLDRHAFKAPFVSSWKWMWDSSEFISTRVGKEGLSRRLWHSRKGKMLLYDLKHRLLHTLHVQRTLKYHCVLVKSGTDTCAALFFCKVTFSLCDCTF